MYTVKLTQEQRKLMLHALTTASLLHTGLTGSEYEAMKQLQQDIANAEDESVPEWQRKKK
jgi:hypothetical protein